MEDSGGYERKSSEEISLLAEELIQLSVKRSMVVPSVKPTLICSDQIRLISSLFWIKIGLCFPEFDKKYLLHAIGSTFGGVIRMGYGLNDCLVIGLAEKNKVRDDPPYTIALKAESNLVGKESLKFNALAKKLGSQCSYTGSLDQEFSGTGKFAKPITSQGTTQCGMQLASWEAGLKD
ncbi:hypothetical protein PVK06_007648 [Gossypium arboreum]|uniref:Uncharacterized protein n=1 Tax=Gossypium arboreum TaxID=29729 RepID=A0ABR0QHX2_GOSAR|nr:hypothetical protein PVK06_007648 [Gossypium arboreum]